MLETSEIYEEIEIPIPFPLLSWQKGVERDRHRFQVVAAGRRSGKTILAVRRLVRCAAKKPGSINWYVGPTYGAAKDIAWGLLKKMVSNFKQHGLIRKANDSDLMVEFTNESVVQLKGASDPDLLRGSGLDELVVDEIAIMKSEVWDEVLRPSTSDREAPVLFIGTPKGYNHFYSLYQNELAFPDFWKSFHIKTIEAGTIGLGEIDQARRDMDERAFRQEYEASFETFGGQVFTDFDRAVHVKPCKYMPELPYFNGQDFGWAAPTATLFIQVDAMENVFVFDESKFQETAIAAIGRDVLKRMQGRFPEELDCDPAGDAKSEAMGTSSVKELQKMGFNVRYRKNYPGVIQDGINLIRKWLRNRKLFIDPKCVNLIQAFEMYRYPDPKNDIQSEIPLKDGISDHWIDGLRYFFLNKFPLKSAEWRVL